MTDNNSLYISVMVIGYVILALLTCGVVIKIASVYARYKGNKRGSGIELKDNKLLAVKQDAGETTILCKTINMPETQEDAAVVVAADGEEA